MQPVLAAIVLNLTVIAVDRGMPVTRAALVASGQEDTLALLVDGDGAKHHLARPDDRLLFLGDVVPVRPLLIVSPGDVVGDAGVAWVIVAGMLCGSTANRRRNSVPAPREVTEGMARGG